MVDTSAFTPSAFLPGEWTRATLPAAANHENMGAWVTDCPGFSVMISDGTIWRTIGKRTETYSGTTDASGNYAVTFATPYSATPHISPVTFPAADATTRVRVTAAAPTGFTVKTEKNNAVTVLAIDVLAIGTANVPSIPVRVLVVES